jgi:hypothetical protein
MKTIRHILALLSLASLTAVAQPGGPGSMPGMDLSVMKIFGEHQAFTCKADIKTLDKTGQEEMSMTADFAMLDGQMRTEVDMSKMRGKGMPPEAIAQMKQMGMDRAINIMTPAEKKMIIAFPNMKAAAKMALPEKDAASLAKSTMEKTELGKETIEGHPCVKNKVVIASEGGKKHEYTLWNATDLKEFPVQFETAEQGRVVRGTYHDINFAKPDAKSFAVPADCKEYASMEEMMAVVMQKMMSQMPHP